MWLRCARVIHDGRRGRGRGEGAVDMRQLTKMCCAMTDLASKANGCFQDHVYVRGNLVKFRASHDEGHQINFLLEQDVDVRCWDNLDVPEPILLRWGACRVCEIGPGSTTYVPPLILRISKDPRQEICNVTVSVEASCTTEGGKALLLVCVQTIRAVDQHEPLTSESQLV